MKSEQAIRERVAELRDDDRLAGDSANVEVNAPLALIQTDLEAKIRALEWVLDDE